MRCCEYYPVAITNGKNTKIYLENDYQAITDVKLQEELAEYNKLKAEAIKAIEEQYSELDMVTTQIING